MRMTILRTTEYPTPAGTHALAIRDAVRPLRRPRLQRGFSFVEILFAVAVLGIGLIMIAAIFPVALLQTKLNVDETTAASNAKGIVPRMPVLADARWDDIGGSLRSLLPGTWNRESDGRLATPAQLNTRYRGIVRTLNDPRPYLDTYYGMFYSLVGFRQPIMTRDMWNGLALELIQPSDPRNAVAVMYRRDFTAVRNPVPEINGRRPNDLVFKADPVAQLIVITAQVANQSAFGPGDVRAPRNSEACSIYNLEPRPVAVQVVYDQQNSAYVASFFSVSELPGTSGSKMASTLRGGYPTGIAIDPGGRRSTSTWEEILTSALDAVTEGAFFVISDDRIIGSNSGRLNGRIFRLGQRRTDLNGLTFDLVPGYDFQPDPGPDGRFNTPTKSSGDDIVCIGIQDDTRTDQLRAGLSWRNGTRPAFPFGQDAADSVGLSLEGGGPPRTQGAVALVLGRGFAKPTWTPPQDGNTYAGPAMDVAAYTTFINVPRQ